MITQAIKRWLNKLFGWLSWGKTLETEYAPVGSPLNKIATQESMSRSSIDGVTPPSGVAPRIAGQGEITCSTIDEWPERVLQPPPPSSPVPNEEIELPPPSTQIPIMPPVDTAKTTTETSPGQGDTAFPAAPLSTPTPEQHLDFLLYLVKRGIVNEGFAEDQVPEQYRK